ncbi:type II toxin-antitoxin system ParD family antitoxin [Stratiformator vulcanicus]|uniref:Type II toxin-antitoxin system ParD family antitoxin n=1 Tax=Stratiformator vulcanicus TaxID=2527980 RepID=A0A517QYV5_9PLAN|nr:type II toxin-antitoxin system ParD family antitoxin [Stratiformator vulcanicus]QDT36826.1 hypothetical protein Pan189_11890 [Stratiformator vulcanicus]
MSTDLEEYVQRKVDSGEYASREEVTEAALNLLKDVEGYHEFRREVGSRIAAADRGELTAFDVDSIKAQLTREWVQP